MTLLIIYVVFALLISFLCSIAEAVLLSVTTAHISVLEQEGKESGPLLRELKGDINKPLAAILTLNTIAHTVGAVGAGAQAVLVFGSTWLGLVSAILTLMILVFSEIIPKTLGATYWRTLSGVTAYGLKLLIRLLYPFVMMSELLTRGLSHDMKIEGFSREEFAAMADLGEKEGQLEERESRILKNMFLLHETAVTDVMTPRPVVFSLPESLTVRDYFDKHYDSRFSRIPVYSDDDEIFTGFVLKDDLLLAQASNNTDNIAFHNTFSCCRIFNLFTDSHFQSGFDKFGNIIICRMIRNAAHGHMAGCAFSARGKDEIQNAAGNFGILKKHFIKVP